MLSQKAIKEFREIYFQEFGERISIEEATKQATNLIQLYKSTLSNSNRQEDINARINNK